jgi:hypothetical protein
MIYANASPPASLAGFLFDQKLKKQHPGLHTKFKSILSYMMIPYPVSMDQKFKKLKEQNIFGSLK